MTEYDDRPVDELAMAAALRRLDRVIASHAELVGTTDDDNTHAWIATLETYEESNMAKEKKEETTQLAFRLPNALIARLDEHVARMETANPGLVFTRVQAVRSLLTRALDEVEAEAKSKRRGREP